jgi:hypothetical protein
MALVLKDRVKETTTTTGTGTVTLAGAATGFQTFGAVGNGNTTYYAIVDNATGDWEVGSGTYTSSGTTLSRTTVLSSSNSGSLVNFAAGSKDVFCTYPSSKSVYLDAADVVAQLSFGAITATSVAMTTGTIATQPVNNTDIVNKEYADALASGIHFHEAVDLATTAALPAATYNNGTGGVGATLTANANGALSVDSTLTVVGNRILVKNQAAGAQNGVYVVTQVGSGGAPFILTRATDFDSVGTGVDQIDEGDFFLVTSGTANVNTAWVQQTPPPITIGTTAIVFQQFSAPITYTAGTGLTESPTYTFNIANVGTAGTYGSASQVPVFVTNARGQISSVTNTAIAISGSAVSGNITGQAGSVANALTAGTFLTSGGTYNGSAARTFAVDATDANTASKVVARDASGNFSAGTITAALSGNATSATNVAGGAANRIVFNTGSGASSFVVAPTASGQVLSWNGSAFAYVAGTISGVALGSNLNSLTAGTYLTGTAYNGSGAQTWTVDATSANTVSKVVARDASGNFSAGTITAALSGNATTATTATNVSGLVAIANGGTGQTTQQAAINALAGTQTANRVLRSDGTNTTLSQVALTTDVTGTLPIANGGTGTTSTTFANLTTNVTGTLPIANGGTGTTSTTFVNLASNVTGTLPVANGGTGATTLTANNVLLGNGTSALQVVAPGTSGNVLTSNGTTWTSAAGLSLSGDNTWTGTQTFSGTSSKLAVVLNDAAETTTVTATAATGTINFDVTTQSVLYYTSNASGNWTLNVRASSGTTLNTVMSTGQSVTIAFIVTNGGTAYYQTGFQVDGSSVTPRWQGGTAPTAGNASSLDVYVVTIIKTGSATFTALASQTKFA